ncbi:hypothetical protein [uncultured Jatrophihabitans sp.]|uniref:hypothetical protein n=1 Tax=uncultured Jatrophihabitans sp. TaxID=1610747 RepID=UPI0035CA0BE2
MIVVLTCVFLIVASGLCAEATRAACRRRLLTPVAVREDASARQLQPSGAAEIV